MKNIAVIATHHKTGTVWMRTVFQQIAKRLKVDFVPVEKLRGTLASAVPVPTIVFAAHSDFRDCRWLRRHSTCRVFHVIRDPRDVVVSAMHYHRKADEGWLHKPQQRFEGLTYQDKINSLPDDHARYLFEMQNGAGRTIRVMSRWNYKRTTAFECRYEDLIDDFQAAKFTEALTHLGFEGDELEIGRSIFLENSYVGQNSRERHPHIRSGAGGQWRSVFDSELGAAFVARFGNILIDLGYEADNAWIETLRSRSGQASGEPLSGLQ